MNEHKADENAHNKSNENITHGIPTANPNPTGEASPMTAVDAW